MSQFFLYIYASTFTFVLLNQRENEYPMYWQILLIFEVKSLCCYTILEKWPPDYNGCLSLDLVKLKIEKQNIYLDEKPFDFRKKIQFIGAMVNTLSCQWLGCGFEHCLLKRKDMIIPNTTSYDCFIVREQITDWSNYCTLK